MVEYFCNLIENKARLTITSAENPYTRAVCAWVELDVHHQMESNELHEPK